MKHHPDYSWQLRLYDFWQKLSKWEQWKPYGFYWPISFVWFWYCLRARSLWFFTSSNPGLEFGGFEGETKSEMYNLLPPGSYPKTIYISPEEPVEAVFQKMQDAGFDYPFIVKPDIGMKGYMFRKIKNAAQLKKYHAASPANYLIQDLADYPLEVSIFYIRYPGQSRGKITAMTGRDPLHVIGNGKSTLRELMIAHPFARKQLYELYERHEDKLALVVPAAERYQLSDAGNRNRGARIVNYNAHITDTLERLLDDYSLYKDQFYWGRYDIKTASLEDIKQGKNFTVLEFNGAGAGPNHIYHCGNSLFQAYKIVLYHWRTLFEISRYNNTHGTPYWPFMRGWKHLQRSKAHFKIMNACEHSLNLDQES